MAPRRPSRAARLLVGIALPLLLSAGSARAQGAPATPGLDPAAIPGFTTDDLGAAFGAFRSGCPALIRRRPPAGSPTRPSGLAAICRAALARPSLIPAAEAAAFFASRFRAYEVGREGETGLLTGYFEPEIPGSLLPSEAFATPLLAMPRRVPSPFPDRAAIEDGALGASARPLVFLRDPVDAFTVHVQGSTRVRLPDGRVVRIAFAGRNGHPYTSIGRLLAERLSVPPSEMPADRLYAWLRDNPEEGRALMRRNRSFIFFRRETALAPDQGPVGAAGTALTPGRSLAIDRTAWPYGIPVWLAGPETGSGRLVIAQDTGAAITGEMRGDLFLGTGEEAGRAAGRLRDRVRFVILWPKGDPPPRLAREAAR